MRLKKGLLASIVLLLLASLALSACGGPQTVEELIEEPEAAVEEAPAEEAAAEQPEAAAEEPEAAEEATEEVAEVEEVGEADLDTAFTAFLGNMVAYNTISPEALNEALAEEDIFLLDVRQPEELEENGYIEGAINIPLRELGENLDKLPSFDTSIVVYCGSGWRATIAMTALGALGWTDVRSLVGGSFGGWVEAGYPVAEGMPPEPEALNAAEPDPALAATISDMLANLPEGWGVLTVEDLTSELAENPDLVLVDVRRSEEVEENGYIEGAVFIPLEEFISMKGEWPASDANIVTYCAAGHRGLIAMTILRSYGYTNVRNLKGGFGAWVDAGNPVATD